MSIPYQRSRTWSGTCHDRQLDAPAYHCAKCGIELYEYDDCALQGGRVLCVECASEEDIDWGTTCHELTDYYDDLYRWRN